MALVEWGGMKVAGFDDALKAPWWFSRVVQIWTRIKGIREAGAYDVDKQVAPRNIWLDEKQLSEWFEERDRLREERSRSGVLPDY